MVFNERLYVFWREKNTNAIKFKCVDAWGGWSSVQDLSSFFMETDGPFDVTVFNGNLYIGFVRPDVRKLYIASCLGTEINDTGYCTDEPSDWKDYGLQKTNMLDIDAWPGIAMTSGSGVNGTDGNEYIYIFVNSPRLSVVKTDDSESVFEVREMPNTHPSYRSYYKNSSGIEVRPSAFPAAGNYLYLTWSWIDDRIYTSVLQNWNHLGHPPQNERAWFTRSVWTGEDSSRGVRFWRHGDYNSMRYVFTSITKNEGYFSVIWGRY